MRMLARVFAASIWAPGAIPADEWKFRNLNRVWLPAYDVVAILAGVVATVQGSPLLNRLFTEPVVNCLGRLNLLGEEIKERRVPA